MFVSPEQWKQWDRQYVWHAFTQMQHYVPLVIERAHGCTLVDIDGHEYLDGVSSLWCNLHGHCHPSLDAALREQAERVAHVTMLGMSTPVTIELARRLVSIAPAGLNHVFYAGDGSSAIEAALKIAFQYWQQSSPPQPRKTKFVCFEDAYHGDTLGSASVGGVSLFHDVFRPLLFDTIRLPVPRANPPVDDMTEQQACARYLSQLEEVLEQRQGEIAAVIIEPLIQAAAGMILHPRGFLRGIRELTRKYDVLMIADEVAVGFGRTGRMFACEHEDVAPDLLCLGKGLTAGYLAMSVAMATDRIYEAFLGDFAQQRTFYHGNTFAGNALAAAVAVASLDVFEEERVLEYLAAKIVQLNNRLQELAQLPGVVNVRSCGLIAAVEVAGPQPRPAAFVCDHALQHGVWVRPLGNVIVIMPPLAISASELDRICAAIRAGILALMD